MSQNACTPFSTLLTLLVLPCLLPHCARAGNASSFSVGTVLFSPSDVQRQCWTQENVALLTTRMLMANLMPNTDKLKAEDDSFISDIIEYFRLLLEVIRTNTDGKTKHIMLLAATDTMGGYMKHLIVPISKYAYYAGNIQYASIIRLYQLYDELKTFLRTNGEGWAKAWKNAGRHIQAKSISVQAPSPTSDPCKGIIYYKHTPTTPAARRGQGQQQAERKACGMEVPLPFFDSKTHPAAIAVPFRTFGLRNLESRVSAYILVKYFVAVSKCMAARNTNDEDVHKFNANIFSFIVSKVMPHLGDERFYAAFGGVLRILQTVTETTKAKGHAIGNINIMPETQDREPPDLQEDENEALAGAGGGGKSKEKTSRNNLILLAALATIVVWFCLGAAFVCCRIKAGKMKDEKALEDDENVCREDTCPALYEPSTTDTEPRETHTKVLYSLKHPKQKLVKHAASKSSSKASKKSSKSSKSTKSTRSGRTITSELDSDTRSESRTPTTTGSPLVLEASVPARSRSISFDYERDADRERDRERERQRERERERERREREQREREQREREEERERQRAKDREREKERQREEEADRQRAREREIERQEEEERRAQRDKQSELDMEEKERAEEKRRLSEATAVVAGAEAARAAAAAVAAEEKPAAAGGDDDAPKIQVHSVQYYPPTFACHTSMTGKIKMDSSTEQSNTDKDEVHRPYVFGYDFQTTSEETTPREPTTDGENEVAGNTSK